MNDDSKFSFIILILFIIIIIIAIVILIYSFAVTSQHNSASTLVTRGAFGQSCRNTSCISGLECDGKTLTCRQPLGQPCTNFFDCAGDNYCSGLCVSGANGQLNENCPCFAGFVCTTLQTGLRTCKADGGQPCVNNSDCYSTLCVAGVCSVQLPDGFPCTLDADCTSNNCSKNFCQPQSVVTGEKGSVCTNSPCDSGLSCINDVCASTNGGLLQPCDELDLCQEAMVCLNSTTAGVCGQNDSCTCFFKFPESNVSNGNVCAGGLSAETGAIPDNICLNDAGIGCNLNSHCHSGVCLAGSQLSGFNFNEEPSLFFQNKIQQLVRRAELPGNVTAKKVFSGQSLTLIDSIYVVDPQSGLWQINYNNQTQQDSQWTKVLDHIIVNGTNIKRLVDAEFSGQIFLVAFLETEGVDTNSTLYRLDNGILSYYNASAGTGIMGTQYDSMGAPLDIEYIDISGANDISAGGDVIITTPGHVVYLHEAASMSALYSVGIQKGGPKDGQQITGVIGPARFYYDIEENTSGVDPPPPSACVIPGQPQQCSSAFNIAYVAGYPGLPGNILQFSGNFSFTFEPSGVYASPGMSVVSTAQFSLFSPPANFYPTDQGMRGSSILTVNNIIGGSEYNLIATNFRLNVSLQGQVNEASLPLVTANAYYILSMGSCQ